MLPILEKKQDIVNLLKQHQVIVLCGETGSGKTTQIPQFCLELNHQLGKKRIIGHTQPRRIAATSTAKRIQQELDSQRNKYEESQSQFQTQEKKDNVDNFLNITERCVSSQIRFENKSSEKTRIKIMTDGILLAEIQHDKLLKKYDTIIIDEAHERSLNIDFLLGYLKYILPKRPDLQIIIMSATIDASQLSIHFNNAPIIEISGRLYPIEIQYCPDLVEEYGDDWSVLIQKAVELVPSRDDVLIFLPGEKQIKEAMAYLPKHECYPLFSRLAQSEQEKVWHQTPHRKIILATNIAETSLTLPSIKYVIDTGLARVKRYSFRHKVEQLPIENIAQANAKQRAGRCGRVSDGMCFRLYDEKEFLTRPLFTEAEIQRSNLAHVLLQMKAQKLPDIQEFPLPNPPSHKAIQDGLQQLFELQAIINDNGTTHLTRLGIELSKLPVDPRIGRMLLEAKKNACLPEMLIIASFLSIQDPKQTPLNYKEESQKAHQMFEHADSDFMGILKLWNFWQDILEQNISKRQKQKIAQERFLSFPRLLEWSETHEQLQRFLNQ